MIVGACFIAATRILHADTALSGVDRLWIAHDDHLEIAQRAAGRRAVVNQPAQPDRTDGELTMPKRIEFDANIEPLVQFIEETSPDEIVDRALEKLRAGVSPQTMLTASALAVTRSTDMPPGHHGGPLHPLA